MSLILEVLQELNNAKVEYIVVGGLAVALHGFNRATMDLDLVVNLDPANAEKTINALLGLGYAPRAPVDPKSFADASVRENWVEEKGLTVFSMFNKKSEYFCVDLFVRYPFDFPGLLARSVVKSIHDVPVRIVGIDDLISMKKKAGRPRDLDDIRALEALKNAPS